MANLTCSSITSITDLLDKADRNLLNITTAIASCPATCSLAWGKGNPDLSGIGANISYIMQSVLTVLCGPVLALIYAFRHQLALDKHTQDRLPKIAYSFIDISAQFNIPVGIAATIRLTQTIPIFEQFFLLCLLGVQTLSFATVVFTTVLFDNLHRKSCLPLVYVGILGILGAVASTLRDNLKNPASKELIKSCKNYSEGVFFIHSAERLSEWRGYLWFGVAITVIIVTGMVVMWRRAQWSEPSLVDLLIQGDRPFLKLAVVFSIIIIVALMIYELSQLEIMRNKLKKATGADFQDDEWGFGQIIAVCLWIPLCLKIIYYVIHFAWIRHKIRAGISEPELEDRDARH